MTRRWTNVGFEACLPHQFDRDEGIGRPLVQHDYIAAKKEFFRLMRSMSVLPLDPDGKAERHSFHPLQTQEGPSLH